MSSVRTARTAKGRKRKKRTWNLKSKIIPMLRRIWFFSPERRDAIKRANGTCEKCGSKVDKLHADHILPVVNPETGFVDWNQYIDRMFCGAIGLQVICEECHAKKSAQESDRRKEVRRIQKDKL